MLVGEIVDRLDDQRLDTVIRVSCDNEDGTMSLCSITSRLIGQMDPWMCAIDNREDDWDSMRSATRPKVFTYGGMIAHVLTFAAYNRTLTVQQLGDLGIDDLGWGDPMRWVAQPA